MGQASTRAWHSLFVYLEKSDLFTFDTDRITAQYVFMPLIRAELVIYIADKNEYPIRRQPNRRYHVAGVPNELYTSQDSLGFPYHIPTLQEWERQLQQFDFNAYLTAETIDWYNLTMQQVHPEPAQTSDFFEIGLEAQEKCPQWYRVLVTAARTHCHSATDPVLALAPREFVDAQHELLEEICAAWGVDGVTEGLIRPH